MCWGQLHAALKPGGVLFSSNPRGDNEEGWSGGRYGTYHDCAGMAALRDGGRLQPNSTITTARRALAARATAMAGQRLAALSALIKSGRAWEP